MILICVSWFVGLSVCRFVGLSVSVEKLEAPPEPIEFEVEKVNAAEGEEELKRLGLSSR